MATFLILPHQLFLPLPDAQKYRIIIIWEHPHYFKAYNYNKKKLVLHRASMRYYYDLLKKRGGFKSVTYLTFKEKPSMKPDYYYDPVDEPVAGIAKNTLESPNFLLTLADYNTIQTFRFTSFYMKAKEIVDIIPKQKPLDYMNRSRLPLDLVDKLPSVPKLDSIDKRYISEAARYVSQHFPKNCGTTEGFWLPVTHTTAKKWLKDFIRVKLKNFGKYQDSFVSGTQLQPMYHSLLSSSLNIGLLDPFEVADEVDAHHSAPMNSREGFIRQLFWREYQRYCYLKFDFKGNYFGNRGRLTTAWYTGETGVHAVDDAIKIAFEYGYLHHIQRLMIIGNFMNLSGISPTEGFRWFMEFSVDSYEWVMYQNVYEMVFFCSGGGTMTRPYISSSNYIKNMSVGYGRCEIWDDLYHEFLKKHKGKAALGFYLRT